MSLKERLFADLKTALKERDAVRKSTITLVRAAILQKEKDEKVVLDDNGVIGIIAKELKQRKESLSDFEKAERSDLIEKTNKEISILNDYLPQQLTDTELEEIVVETIKQVGATDLKDMGKVMGAIMPKVLGRVDGSQVNALVKKHLQ